MKKRRNNAIKLGLLFTIILLSLSTISVSYSLWYGDLTIDSDIATFTGDFECVGYWKFDEGSGLTAYDSSIYENDGNIVNATWEPNGKIGKALSFDGDDYVEVTDSNTLDITNEITILCWIKPSSLDDYESFVHKDNTYVLQFAPGPNGYLRGALWLPSLTMLDDTSTKLSTDIWYHVGLTYDGSFMRLFVNGSEVANKPATGNIATNNNPLFVGYNPRGITYWYRGVLDETKVYSRALEPSEIFDEYQSGTI